VAALVSVNGESASASRREALSDALKSAGRGEKVALESIYAATSAKLFGICLRILRDRQEAEDVLQEVYLSVWRRAGSFDPARATSYHDHNEAQRVDGVIDRLRLGARVALVSDAGTPLCSDPGYVVVSRAVEEGIAVCPVPGAPVASAPAARRAGDPRIG